MAFPLISIIITDYVNQYHLYDFMPALFLHSGFSRSVIETRAAIMCRQLRHSTFDQVHMTTLVDIFFFF